MSLIEPGRDLSVFIIIIVAIVWLAKILGKHLINKNLKLFESELTHKIEEYKSKLEILNEKQSKLHEKRLDCIHNFYGLLTEYYLDVENLVQWKNVTGKTDEEIEEGKFKDAKKTYESGYNLSIFYEKNKLYFDKTTCEMIEHLFKELKSCQYDLTIKYQWINISIDFQMEKWQESKEKLNNSVPKLKKKLEENFREILGV